MKQLVNIIKIFFRLHLRPYHLFVTKKGILRLKKNFSFSNFSNVIQFFPLFLMSTQKQLFVLVVKQQKCLPKLYSTKIFLRFKSNKKEKIRKQKQQKIFFLPQMLSNYLYLSFVVNRKKVKKKRSKTKHPTVAFSMDTQQFLSQRTKNQSVESQTAKTNLPPVLCLEKSTYKQ